MTLTFSRYNKQLTSTVADVLKSPVRGIAISSMDIEEADELNHERVHHSELAVLHETVHREAVYHRAVHREAIQLTNELEDSVEQCLKATHITEVVHSPSLMQQAKRNARYLFEEYRKVIPELSLDGYRSHCWRASFSARWDETYLSGHIGDISLRKPISTSLIPTKLLRSRTLTLPDRHFESDLVCLPKVFLAGFYKCGSTFLYCLLNKLTSVSANCSQSIKTIEKEPRFWVQMYQGGGAPHLPTRHDVVKYAFNFLPGLQEIVESDKHKMLLVCGKPEIMSEWPKYEQPGHTNSHSFTNYCILPAVLSRLFSDSKYLVIVRKPDALLYSEFWFSCKINGVTLSNQVKLKAPDIFHKRVVSQINSFNSCMRDSSVPSTSHKCELGGEHNYTSCILQRLHLLEKCVGKLNNRVASREMGSCGIVPLNWSFYYVHIRKWLTIVPRDCIFILTLEDFTHDISGYANSIMEFLDMGTEFTAGKDLLDDAASGCRGTPPLYKEDSRYQMRKDTKTLLETFYEPFNSVLQILV